MSFFYVAKYIEMKFGFKRKICMGFLFCLFIIGFLFCLNPQVTRENFLETLQEDSLERVHTQKNNNSCPDLLIRSGNELKLFNTKEPPHETNPRTFQNLDRYLEYLDYQRREEGVRCPVLFLQEESNTQGETVYRMRPSPVELQPGIPVQVMDSSDDRKPFNQGQFQGFDAHGQQVGQYTTLDCIHDSTTKAKVSDNPMDPNWGGVSFSQAAVDSGKYAGSEVGKPTMNPKVFEIFK
jgi:hypothetical protein